MGGELDLETGDNIAQTDMARGIKSFEPGMEPVAPQQPPSKTSKPTIAGILLILGGILGLFTWISAYSFDYSMIDPSLFQQEGLEIGIEQLQSFIQICATIGIVLSIFPILGGILALKRKIWAFVLLGSILGLFTIGPVLISSVLSLIALILLVLSRKEFEQSSGIESF